MMHLITSLYSPYVVLRVKACFSRVTIICFLLLLVMDVDCSSCYELRFYYSTCFNIQSDPTVTAHLL
jgi:hypothetical protein